MLLASCFAGIGFGNAGTHLCHGMSYPISGLVKSFKSKDYSDDHPLVPHACPERHLQAAEALGVDIRNVKKADAGKVLRETLLKIMKDIECPDGIESLGYTANDIPALVKGTLPQHRVTGCHQDL
ncbi:Hydroxyacid-oxoacid transhydrogenase, mitochondrial [Bulinus truncatus]|nr:Hydroxyacid-oxoacid transhydrogenase, mitochondrial [Bulinus truncatus]